MKHRLSMAFMPRERGVPADRDELKVRRGIMVTPTAWTGLEAIVKRLGYKSKSDLIEAIGRGELEVLESDATTSENSE